MVLWYLACFNIWIILKFKVLESALEGSRKPEEKFYHKLLERLKMNPEEVVFLDDFGKNLKPAQKMGFQTIKVKSKIGNKYIGI